MCGGGGGQWLQMTGKCIVNRNKDEILDKVFVVFISFKI